MKVGITFSTFDLFHAGHVKMLEEAKRQCDYLIVGLQLDPSIDRPEKNGPSQSIIERYIQLKGSKHVDEIVPYVSEQHLEDVLKSFKIDVRIIGDEYKEKNFTGRTYCEEKGIEIFAYSPPTSKKMREIETGMSGLDMNELQVQLNAIGVHWIEVDINNYTSYDGSHIFSESAERLSVHIGESILPFLSNTKSSKKNN